MENPVYLDEDIPFVESGVYEIDGANGTTTTTLGHGNIIELNSSSHSFDNDSMWTSNVTGKRGRRPKSTAVVITTTTTTSKNEPKRRGRKPKQDTLNSSTTNKSNDLLLDTTDDLSSNKQRRTNTGMKSNKKIKLEDQQQQNTSKMIKRSFNLTRKDISLFLFLQTTPVNRLVRNEREKFLPNQIYRRYFRTIRQVHLGAMLDRN